MLRSTFPSSGGPAVDDRQILLYEASCLHRLREPRVRGLGLRDDEDAGGVLVETVDEPGAVRLAAPLLRAEEERVHEGAVPVPDRGVDDEAGRLVEDEEVLVLEEDRERDVLRTQLRLRRRGRREDGVDEIAGGDLRGGLRDGATVDGDEARADPLLDLRPGGLRKVGEVAEEDAVEALAVVAAIGGEVRRGRSASPLTPLQEPRRGCVRGRG